MSDNLTPAIDQAGGQPEVSINGQGWSSEEIGVLEDVGFGNYRALLSEVAIAVAGNIIISHYTSTNTLDSYGEPIQVVPSLTQIPIFDSPTSPPSIISYISLPEAEQYFSTRLNSDSWTQASTNEKIAALVSATRDINNLNFIGIKFDPMQDLEFPRAVMAMATTLSGTVEAALINPSEIKFACCEIAYNYLDGLELEAEINRIIVEGQKYNGVNETYNRISVNEAKRAGIISNRAWIYLKPYLRDGYALRVREVE